MQIEKIGGDLISKKARNVLLEMMTLPEIQKTGKLPREEKLVELLGVSRTALRDALVLLERDMLITRRRGLGTMINKEIVELRNRLDVNKEFNVMIQDAGYTPSVLTAEISVEPADEESAGQLSIQPGAQLYRLTKLMGADDVPVIYCHNYMDRALFPQKQLSRKAAKQPVYDILDEHCQIRIHHEVTRLTTSVLDQPMKAVFRLPEKDTIPVLQFTETAYDIDSRPVMFSRMYQRADLIEHTLVRRQL